MCNSTKLFLFVAVIGLGTGCADKKTAPADGLEPSAVERSDVEEVALPPIDEAAVKQGTATLSQGTMTALGLSIPKGMLPGKAPEKVYRFEGAYPLVHVAGFIREQVSIHGVEREGNGYLMRKARVRRPKGNATGKERLAIRIFQGNKGGGTIDIWLEKDYMKSMANRRSHGRSYASRKKPKTTRLTPAASRKRRTTKRETFRIMRKVSRGEKLTAEEMERYH